MSDETNETNGKELKPEPIQDELTITNRVTTINRIASLLSLRQKQLLIIAFTLIGVIALALIFWRQEREPAIDQNRHEHEREGVIDQVTLSPEALSSASIETVEVGSQPIVTTLLVTGTVQANQQQIQQATPLISGRTERVNVQLGDWVKAGTILAVIASPQIAQMHGKLHEAETRLALAERNLQRVQRSENRVAVLTAKAKLDETETTLRRIRRIVELGAGAAKDLIAAEAAFQTAKAEYEFHSNIALNREIQESKAEVETARVDVTHIRDELLAYGVSIVGRGEQDDHDHNTAIVPLRAPISGTVIERLVNAGAGIEAGKALFTIANLSTVWVIANIPESQIKHLRVGTQANIRAAALTESSISGYVTYINPLLNEETRTVPVRIEVSNVNEQLKIGMFVEVDFPNVEGAEAKGEELVIPEEAVQRIDTRTVVFIPKQDRSGNFEVRNVELGSLVNGYRRIVNGLSPGERVVTKGSFTLKGQLLRGELEEDHH
ncbi:MAG: efflux RND transporter periplasmic adaptor subunit [Acidobacteriota bacterium]